jgi:hypothetical protein
MHVSHGTRGRGAWSGRTLLLEASRSDTTPFAGYGLAMAARPTGGSGLKWRQSDDAPYWRAVWSSGNGIIHDRFYSRLSQQYSARQAYALAASIEARVASLLQKKHSPKWQRATKDRGGLFFSGGHDKRCRAMQRARIER